MPTIRSIARHAANLVRSVFLPVIPARLHHLQRVVMLLLLCSFVFLPAGRVAATAEPTAQGGDPAQPYDCSQLDWGVYWYGYPQIENYYDRDYRYMGGTSRKAYPDGRTIPGFYDPTKPTVMFVHGWQRGFVERGRRDDPANPTLVFAARHEFEWRTIDPLMQGDPQWQFADPTQVINVAKGWLDRGWNVGVFHWTQLADDDDFGESSGRPTNAEAKIWTADYPNVKMRWRTCNPDGTTSFETRDEAMPTAPVKDLFYAAYKAAMARYSGTEVRLVGHSLGAQLSVATTKLLYDDLTMPTNQKPTRVVLADPYWTSPLSDGYKPEGLHTGEITRNYVRDLKQSGVIFERNTTSDVNEYNLGDANRDLDLLISNTKYDVQYLSGPTEIFNRHTAGYKLYFWSQAFPAPDECAQHSTDQCALTGRRAQSAATPDDRARAMTDPDDNPATEDGAVWEQVTGKDTPTPEDDTFKCTNSCTQRVLLYGPTGGAARLAVIQDYLAESKFTTQTIISFPTDEQLAETGLLVINVPSDDSRERVVEDFVKRGGVLLLLGEHGRGNLTGAATMRAYAARFLFTINTDIVLPQCLLTNKVEVTGGIPVTGNVMALVAGTATVARGTPVLQTADGRTVLAVIEDYEGGGRVAVAGDSNIFAGCAAFREPNRRFAVALFDWLSGRR